MGALFALPRTHTTMHPVGARLHTKVLRSPRYACLFKKGKTPESVNPGIPKIPPNTEKQTIEDKGGMTALEKFKAPHGGLTWGLTDRSFRHVTSLKVLLIYNNRLTSVLPEQGLLYISSLAVCCVFENRLAGALPTHGLAGLTLVFELDLQMNRFTGGLPG
eukprot:2314023-Amphidinium_carterae.1